MDNLPKQPIYYVFGDMKSDIFDFWTFYQARNTPKRGATFVALWTLFYAAIIRIVWGFSAIKVYPVNYCRRVCFLFLFFFLIFV